MYLRVKMAIYYFDSVNGSDSNNGISEQTPWANWQAKFGANVFAGDTCAFKRGTQQVVTTQFQGLRGGSNAANPSKMIAYGPYGPKPKFVYGGTPWGYILNAANISNFLIEDLDFDGLGANSTIYIAAQGTGSVSNWRINRSDFHNSGVNRNGLSFSKESSATSGAASGLTIFGCNFYDNGQHGLISIAASGVRVFKSKAYANGYNAGTGGGHGFSSRWDRADVTSGWTLVSGNIYSRGLSSAETAEGNIGYVQTSIPNKTRLNKNTNTPTTPGSYEYGVSGSTLYINLNGSNPNGQNIRYAYHRCTDIIYEDCEAYSNIVNPLSQFQEGNGFAFDDFTDTSVFRRCKSYNNQGRGFSINRGDGNIVEDSLAWGNGLTGVSSNTSQSLTIRRSTFVYNGIGNSLTSFGQSEMYFSPQVNVSISQSVVVAQSNAPLAINDDNFSTVAVDKSSVSGGLALSNAVVFTNPINGDPKVTQYGVPKIGSPVLGAGTHGGYTRDVNRVQRNRPPSIGAIDTAQFSKYPPAT